VQLGRNSSLVLPERKSGDWRSNEHAQYMNMSLDKSTDIILLKYCREPGVRVLTSTKLCPGRHEWVEALSPLCLELNLG